MNRYLRYTAAPLLAWLTSFALAANFTHLLPQETVLAVGAFDLAAHQNKLDDFTAEWQRLGLSELLAAALAEEAGDDAADMPAGLENLSLMDVIGREAWLGVSLAAFNPLPAVTVVAQVTPQGAQAARALFPESEGEVQTFTEGAITFEVATSPPDEFGEMDQFDAAFSAIAFAQFDDMVALSTNPDVLRGVLRRYQGSGEAGLSSNVGFAATVGQLPAGNGYYFVDLPAVVTSVAPFGAGMGFDNVIARLSGALDAAGVNGSVMTIAADGIEGRTLRVLGDASSDPQVHALLANPAPVTDGARVFVGPNTVTYGVSTFDAGGWWGWLKGVVASAPELGIGDLDSFLNEMVGIDISRLLIGWMGNETAVISAASAPTAEVGMALENPLGDSVYAIRTDDPAAAEAGLAELLAMASMMVSGFTSADGMGSQTPPSTRQVAGVSVTDYAFGSFAAISTAVVDGYALIATTTAAMDDALNARQQGLGLSASLAALRPLVPAGVTAFSVSDDSATLRTLSQSVAAEMGMLVGLAPGEIDFDSAEAAGDALAAFFEFVSGRMSGSYSYSYVEGANVRGVSHIGVAW